MRHKWPFRFRGNDSLGGWVGRGREHSTWSLSAEKYRAQIKFRVDTKAKYCRAKSYLALETMVEVKSTFSLFPEAIFPIHTSFVLLFLHC